MEIFTLKTFSFNTLNGSVGVLILIRGALIMESMVFFFSFCLRVGVSACVCVLFVQVRQLKKSTTNECVLIMQRFKNSIQRTMKTTAIISFFTV